MSEEGLDIMLIALLLASLLAVVFWVVWGIVLPAVFG